MEFEYKVSVIVPVYNAEKTLGRTMDSLLAQTLGQEETEVLLIDDGSTDGSPALCDQYARERFNVHVIHQENAGVSAARNAGIRAAKGKYLLYLDGDDTLSRESLKNITDFFDAHYAQIDLVTYPLLYQYEGGESAKHFRYNYLKKTGIYSLDQYPAICQTTINVCVKNTPHGQLYFDTSLELAEDQLYNTRMLAKTGKIGFVAEAKYIYYRTDSSASSTKNAGESFFDARISAYQTILEIGKKKPSMRRYCENLLINNFSWNITGNSFLPPATMGEKRDAGMRALVGLVDGISPQTIMQYPDLDPAYKFYLLSLKSKGRPFVCADEDGLKILDSSGQLDCQTHVPIVIEQMEDVPGGFYLMAYVKCPALAFTQEIPRLFVRLPGKQRQELPVFFSRNSCHWTKFETNRFFAFHLFIPDSCPGQVRFEMSLYGVAYPTKLLYMIKQRVHPYIGCRHLEGERCGLVCQESCLEVKRVTDPAFIAEKRAFDKLLFKDHKKQWLARQVMKPRGRGRVWLYHDSHDSLDNGYYQFLHDVEKRDGVRRYYVYHGDNPGLIEGKFHGKAKRGLVEFGSVRHKRLLAAAEKLLVAFADRTCYLPFDPNTYQYYADLFHYQVVYLQHGVMHAQLPNMYSKEKVWQVDQVVVSTRFERDNLLTLGYREEDILTCGMPRLDRLNTTPNGSGERKILFAPSWRCSLVETVNGAQTPVADFDTSTYYREFSAFLKDERLHKLLEKNDLYLDVQIHPMFSCYAGCFLPAGSARIRETRFANVAEYLACITDFSSFMFDFIYLGRPVISYFPDQEEFRNGSHSYNDFYYPLEDGFALFCEDKTAALDTLEKLAADGFSLPPKVARRVEDLYYSRKADHMEALYHALMGGK